MSTVKNGQIFLYCFKLQKDLELVPSLQHWVKKMLEVFVIQHTSIWPSFILIGLTIHKK